MEKEELGLGRADGRTLRRNTRDSVRMNNKGAPLHEQFCMTNGVEAIIPKETFEKVQAEKKRRSNYVEDENGRHRSGKKYSAKRKDVSEDQ